MKKQCPQCGRSFKHDSFNFCLEDGTPLLGVNDPDATLVMDSTGPDVPSTPSGIELWQIAETMLSADPTIGFLMEAPVLLNFLKYLEREYPGENKRFLETTWDRYERQAQDTQKLLMQGLSLKTNEKRRVFFKVQQFM